MEMIRPHPARLGTGLIAAGPLILEIQAWYVALGWIAFAKGATR